MTLVHIFVFAFLSVLIGRLTNKQTRLWILFVASLLAVYALQPETSLRQFDFWFPSATIALTVLTWFIIRQRSPLESEHRYSLGAIAALMLVISATRILPRPLITTTYPPQIHIVLIGLTVMVVITAAVAFVRQKRYRTIPAAIVFILLLFVVIKSEVLQLGLSRVLRLFTGQSPELASRIEITWLGFSYVAFRLIHTLRDCAAGRFQQVSLQEFFIYVLFYPALTAGPIDRIEHFVGSLRQVNMLTPARFACGGRRIAIGMLKKFIFADSLAILALNEITAAQVDSRLWLWLLLYAYAFHIYLDFSGYTDLAIGIGAWAGIDLPENFERPYLQSDISAFWNRWHITLTQWFRFYVFNPLTRRLRTLRVNLPVWTVIFLGQLVTMISIGMWHGIARQFLLWGVWQGMGLFIHNRWVSLCQKVGWRSSSLQYHPIWRAVSSLITFQYVALGWVWFAIPDVEIALDVLHKLMGI